MDVRGYLVADARLVLRLDHGDDRVHASAPRLRDQRRKQPAPDAAPVVRGVDVDGVLTREPVA